MNSKIFKISTDTDPDRKNIHMFGSYVSSDDHALLTLSALFRKTSKSILFREIIADWIRQTDTSLETWIGRIAEQCYHIWCIDYKSLENEKQSLADYRKALKQDLKARHLSDVVVDEIIKKFDGFNK